MKVAHMRLVDRWLGTPVCFLLTLWRKVFGRRPPDASFIPKRILFIKLAEQGSTVLAQGALREAIRRVGRENVFFLLFEENRPILDILALIPEENVIAIRSGGLFGTIKSAVSTVWKLRGMSIDVVIDLEFFARASAALCYLSKAKWRVGYHAFGGEASYRGDLMTHRLSFNPYLHTSDAFRMMVEALDRPWQELPTFPRALSLEAEPDGSFIPGEDEICEVRETVAGLLPAHRRLDLILLNANASDLIPLRKWSSERYIGLAKLLLAKFPEVAIAFTGAPSEREAAESLVEQVGSERCISMAGKTTLRQLLVLCSQAEVLVTNDSGPAHFATLTPVDVVVLFGPETPKLFGARSPRTHALWAGLACSPCINAFNNRNSPCRNNVCMQELGVQDVFREVSKCYVARLTRAGRPLRVSA